MENTSKQPAEKYFIEADFSRVWTPGDTVDLNSSTFVALNAAGDDKTSTVLDGSTKAISASTKGIKIKVQAGVVAESPYKLTCTCVTIGGATFELDMGMVIFDE